MIGRITGKLMEKHPPQVLLDVAGVGYEIDVPMSTFYNLPAVGGEVTLHTHLVVREDAHLLYGFGSEAERQAFRQLLKIAGIGAKTALAVLSGLSVADLASAVALQQPATLVKIPGIGKKTAERLLLELKGKMTSAPADQISQHGSDVLNALAALGYSDREAAAAVAGLPAGLPVAEAIRAALKALARER